MNGLLLSLQIFTTIYYILSFATTANLVKVCNICSSSGIPVSNGWIPAGAHGCHPDHWQRFTVQHSQQQVWLVAAQAIDMLLFTVAELQALRN